MHKRGTARPKRHGRETYIARSVGYKSRMHGRTDITVIPLEGDLDVTTAPRLKLAIEQIARAGCSRVIVNMANAQYMDTAGMGALVVESRRLRAAGGLLSIVNAGPQVLHALQVARLVDFIPTKALGANKTVPDLDPSVRPLWSRTLHVGCDELGVARRRLTQLMADTPFSPDETFDLTLAAGEALGNAIDHTDAQGVLLQVTAYPDRLVVQVSDCGCGYQPDEEAEASCCDERGRGIKLMRLLADSVDIRLKDPGPGTVVTLIKLVNVEGVA